MTALSIFYTFYCMNQFTFYRTPRLHFGCGSLAGVPDILRHFGWKKIALFTGSHSFRDSQQYKDFMSLCTDRAISVEEFSPSGEPSPDFIDEAAASRKEDPPSAVVSVGGGSVIDTGKAVSAMVKHEKPVKTYLEGVGSEKPTGAKVPFIAIPTTAGTGSEASKNAVISEIGPGGFKKSLRHDNFVPDIAVIDPELAASCPASVTAASGLDAITQILEGYVSTKSSPITDSLAGGGLKAAGRSFEKAVTDGTNLEARADMAYAAYISGIVLANAGLGVVHGIAGPLGGLYPVPHGVACGTLIAEATSRIIDKLFETGDEARPALEKYAEAGIYLGARERTADTKRVKENCGLLIETLSSWVERYKIPRLGEYGIEEQHLDGIAELTGLKNTPVNFSKQEIMAILKKRL